LVTSSRDDLIEVAEYKTKGIPSSLIEGQDIRYLKDPPFEIDSHSPRIRLRELKGNKVEIENTSYSGIIQLERTRIHFSTKVRANLFYLLSFLRDEDSLKFDPERIIDIKEGFCFFDVLGRLFLNELDQIFAKGLNKKYVKEENNIGFLKGKLIFKRQIQNETYGRAKFFCSYDDLTYNNLENQIVLKATTLLIPLIRFNQEIKRDLIRYSHLLSDLVSSVEVSPEDCDRIVFSRSNDYYQAIIQFSKVVLQNYFIRSVYRGESRGFNFIVNMNRVYEDFITAIIEELVREEMEFRDYIVEKQQKIESLVRGGEITVKPDIILRKKNTNERPLIIDAKYRKQESNADYYQVIAYALAIPTAKVCCLIYPDDGITVTSELLLDVRPYDAERDVIPLRSARVNLFLKSENEHVRPEYYYYINKIKSQVKRELIETMRRAGQF